MQKRSREAADKRLTTGDSTDRAVIEQELSRGQHHAQVFARRKKISLLLDVVLRAKSWLPPHRIELWTFRLLGERSTTEP